MPPDQISLTEAPTPAVPPFQKALAGFRARLSKTELESFKISTIDDVKQTIVDIQARQEEKQESMNLSRILGFLEAMTQFGKVVEVFLNTSEILAFIWGPMKFLLLVSTFIVFLQEI